MLRLNTCVNHIFTICVLSLIVLVVSSITATAGTLYSERASIVEIAPHDPDDWNGFVVELDSTAIVGSCPTSTRRPGNVLFVISKSAVQIYDLVLQAFLTNRQIQIQIDDAAQLHNGLCKVRAVTLNTDGL